MPFSKEIKSGKHKGQYKSPSGKFWTQKQLNLYYATGGSMNKKDIHKKKKGK